MRLTLVGSTKFKDRFIELNKRLTLAGHTVYTVAFHSHADNQVPTNLDKQMLDLVHLKKIADSDGVVLVTDDTGYWGESTGRELQWAWILGRHRFMTAEQIETLCTVPADQLWLKDQTAVGHGG